MLHRNEYMSWLSTPLVRISADSSPYAVLPIPCLARAALHTYAQPTRKVVSDVLNNACASNKVCQSHRWSVHESHSDTEVHHSCNTHLQLKRPAHPMIATASLLCTSLLYSACAPRCAIPFLAHSSLRSMPKATAGPVDFYD